MNQRAIDEFAWAAYRNRPAMRKTVVRLPITWERCLEVAENCSDCIRVPEEISSHHLDQTVTLVVHEDVDSWIRWQNCYWTHDLTRKSIDTWRRECSFNWTDPKNLFNLRSVDDAKRSVLESFPHTIRLANYTRTSAGVGIGGLQMNKEEVEAGAKISFKAWLQRYDRVLNWRPRVPKRRAKLDLPELPNYLSVERAFEDYVNVLKKMNSNLETSDTYLSNVPNRVKEIEQKFLEKKNEFVGEKEKLSVKRFDEVKNENPHMTENEISVEVMRRYLEFEDVSEIMEWLDLSTDFYASYDKAVKVFEKQTDDDDDEKINRAIETLNDSVETREDLIRSCNDWLDALKKWRQANVTAIRYNESLDEEYRREKELNDEMMKMKEDLEFQLSRAVQERTDVPFVRSPGVTIRTIARKMAEPWLKLMDDFKTKCRELFFQYELMRTFLSEVYAHYMTDEPKRQKSLVTKIDESSKNVLQKAVMVLNNTDRGEWTAAIVNKTGLDEWTNSVVNNPDGIIEEKIEKFKERNVKLIKLITLAIYVKKYGDVSNPNWTGPDDPNELLFKSLRKEWGKNYREWHWPFQVQSTAVERGLGRNIDTEIYSLISPPSETSLMYVKREWKKLISVYESDAKKAVQEIEKRALTYRPTTILSPDESTSGFTKNDDDESLKCLEHVYGTKVEIVDWFSNEHLHEEQEPTTKAVSASSSSSELSPAQPPAATSGVTVDSSKKRPTKESVKLPRKPTTVKPLQETKPTPPNPAPPKSPPLYEEKKSKPVVITNTDMNVRKGVLRDETMNVMNNVLTTDRINVLDNEKMKESSVKEDKRKETPYKKESVLDNEKIESLFTKHDSASSSDEEEDEEEF